MRLRIDHLQVAGAPASARMRQPAGTRVLVLSSTMIAGPAQAKRSGRAARARKWYAFELYSDQTGSGEGANATGFDIGDFGLGGGDQVTIVQLANLIGADTLGVAGTVLFDGSGAPHGFAGGSLDPDPLYVGVLNGLATPSAVPVPAALPLMAAALGGFAMLGWRRRKPA